MLGVISLHCNLGNLDNPMAFIMSRISGISIPLFFMVSGFLLSEKTASINYSIKKILGILRFVFIITFACWGFYSVIHGFDLHKMILFTCGSLVQKGPFWMFWYLGAMCFIYILLPILSRLKKSVNSFYLKLFLLLICIEFVVFVATIITHFEYTVIQSFRIWNWLTYFTLGAIVKEYLLDNNKDTQPVSLKFCLISAIFFVVFVHFCKPYIDGIEYFFTTPLCMLYTFSVFLVMAKLSIEKNRVISELAKLFLPVYTLHFFIIIYSRQLFNISLQGFALPVVEWVIVSIVTIVFSYCLMKIPFIKAIFRI